MRRGRISFPGVQIIPRERIGKIIFWLYCFVAVGVLGLMVLMMFGVPGLTKEEVKYGYGADIIFILDESGSMEGSFSRLARGNNPTRKIDAAKKAILEFVSKKRRVGQDRYGLIVFGNTPIKILSLTFNHTAFLRAIEIQESPLWGTELNRPMIVALREMFDSPARSKIMVFVSDGGVFMDDDKYRFSKFVQELAIKFYWIGIDGTQAKSLMADFMSRIGLLGKHVEAYDLLGLEASFDEIFSAERSLIAYKEKTPVYDFGGGYIVLSFMAFLLLLKALFFEGGNNDED